MEVAKRRTPKALPLPENTEPLLPIAYELIAAIGKAKPEHYKRAELKDASFPEVTVSKVLAERVAKAFHVLLRELEPLGIRFQKFKGLYDSGYFERNRARLYLTITEDLIRPDGTRGVSAWQWPREKASPSGFLTFYTRTDRYADRDPKRWDESAKAPLEKTLAAVAAGIRKHFLDLQERREREKIQAARDYAEWLKQREKFEREEAIRLEAEKKRMRAEAIAAEIEARRSALLKAADNWRQSNALIDFINACELRWKGQMGALALDHIAWVTWAREIALAISPFSVNYPDPSKDGALVLTGTETQFSGQDAREGDDRES